VSLTIFQAQYYIPEDLSSLIDGEQRLALFRLPFHLSTFTVFKHYPKDYTVSRRIKQTDRACIDIPR
jgi:hypothetical protein